MASSSSSIIQSSTGRRPNRLQRIINLCNTWLDVDRRQSQQLINPLTDPDDDEEEIFYHLNHLFVQPGDDVREDTESRYPYASGQSHEAMRTSISYRVERILQSLDEPVHQPALQLPPPPAPPASLALLTFPSLPTPVTSSVYTNVSPCTQGQDVAANPTLPRTTSSPSAGESSHEHPAAKAIRLLSSTEPMPVESGGSNIGTESSRILFVPDVYIPLKTRTDEAILKSYPVSVTTGMKERAHIQLAQKAHFLKSGWPILLPDLESRWKELIFFRDPELNDLVIKCLTREDCLSSLSRTVRVCVGIFWSDREFLLDHVTRNIFFNRSLSRGIRPLSNIVHFYELFVYAFGFHDATQFNGSDMHKQVYMHLGNYQAQVRVVKAGGRRRMADSANIGVSALLSQWRSQPDQSDVKSSTSPPSDASNSGEQHAPHHVRNSRPVKKMRRRRRSISSGGSHGSQSSSGGDGITNHIIQQEQGSRERIMPSRRVKNEGHDRLAKLAAAVVDRSDDEDDLLKRRKSACRKGSSSEVSSSSSMQQKQHQSSCNLVPIRSSPAIGFSQLEAHNVGIRLRKLINQPYISSPDPRHPQESWLTHQVRERIRKIHLFTSNSHDQNQLLRKLILRDDSVADVRILIKNVATVMIGRKDVPSDNEDDTSGDHRMSDDDDDSGGGGGASGDRRSLVRYSVGFKSTVLLLMKIFGHDWHGPADVEKFKNTHVYEHLINFIHDNDHWLD